MRVRELASDLKVGPDLLLQYLRQKDAVRGGSKDAAVADAEVAKLRALLERARRERGIDAPAFIEGEVGGRKPKGRRRRAPAAPPKPTAPPEPEVDAGEMEAAASEPGDLGVEAAPISEPSPSHAETASASTVQSEQKTTDRRPDPASPPPPAEPSAPERLAAASQLQEPALEQPVPARLGDVSPAAPAPAKPAASAGPGGRVRIQAKGYTADGRRQRERKKGRRRKGGDRAAAAENVRRVMGELKGGGKKRRKGRGAVPIADDEFPAEEQGQEELATEATTVRVNEFLTVAELAELVGVNATDIIGSAFKQMDMLVTINQRLDFDQIEFLLDGFGFKAIREEGFAAPADPEEEDDPADLLPRPPVVTVMGHVDHGKTRLLDQIRDTNVVAGEAGGITQHIGAYHVALDDGRAISFLDTPGHAAFTAMRARGADLTDVVVLVVAADDAVMPQTVEAINHAKNAGVPLVVAVNKTDLPTADPAKVKQDLLQHDVAVEEFGGDVLVAEVSARTGDGTADLLDKILLQAELLEIKANPSCNAVGAVVEAELDVGKGPVATVLVRKGTLNVGDSFVVGLHDGRVRALLDERGRNVKSAGPGVPVQMLGSAGMPQAGDTLHVMDAVQAATVAAKRQRLDREKQLRIKQRGIKLGDFSQLMASGQGGVLRLVVKGDVDGSVQALADALEQLSGSEVQVEIIHRGVGAINESDVMLALAAGAVAIGFRVRPDPGARRAADRENVDVQVYDVIYEAVEDVRAALEGLLAPERREEILGAAEIRAIFKIRGVGTIAGSYVTEGMMRRGAKARVIRDGVVAYDGEIGSLRRFKDDVKEVKEGFECGIGIAGFNDVKVGDLVETYRVDEVARSLVAAEQA